MTAENATLNGGAAVAGDLLVPGVPTIRLNGNPTYGGTVDGSGDATPANYTITLNGGASLGHVVRRTNAAALPAVTAPPQPAGTRSVSLNNPTQSPGDFTTLRNLTLNSNAGQITVPPGTYGNFNVNSGSGFTIGLAGGTTPAAYNFQNLTLNSNSTFTVLGPVVVTVNGGFSTNSGMGSSVHPEWLNLRIAGGGLSLNGNVAVYANLEAPDGTLTLNGNTTLTGAVAVDRLIVNGNSLLRLTTPAAPNRPPTVLLTAPANGSSFTAPAGFTLAASAADADGTMAKVEFYQGATKLGEVVASPFSFAVNGVAAGSYSFSARAVDNLGATTASAPIGVTVTAPANQPPTVSLTAPLDGASFTAPAVVTLAAVASDPDGTVARVEFYQGGTKIGEDAVAPYQFTTASLAAGSYAFSARAYDNLGAAASSPSVSVTVSRPNQAPAVTLAAPADGATYSAPAGFLLAATATDPDGSVAKVEFYQNGSKVGQAASAPFEFAVGNLAAGTYRFFARAADNAGLTADSASVSVAVITPNVAPSVALSAPTEGANYTAPATINLAATAVDSDGTVAKVEFFRDGVKLGEDIVAPYEFTWTSVPPGTYLLTARATDNAGTSATSSAVTVIVTDNGLPFLANFEPTEGYQPGSLNGQMGWNILGSASVVTSPLYAGSQAVSVAPAVPPALLVRAFANSDASVTFVDFFAQPAAAADPGNGVFFETDAARVALTGASPAGTLQAFNGDGAGAGAWFPTTEGPLLDTTGRAVEWLRLTVRSDYAGKTWDLYLNGRMIAADLGFINRTVAAFTGLGLTGHTTLATGFDDLLVAFDNPLFADADHDGMDDTWETARRLNPTLNDRDGDPDHDGLTNVREYILGTDPAKADTDGDGLPDGYELSRGLDPKLADAMVDIDGNGLSDAWELLHFGHTGVDADADSDEDGQTNAQEYAAGSSPVDYYNGNTPVVTSLFPDGGALNDGISLNFQVTDQQGNPLANAPVTFSAQGSAHGFSPTKDDRWSKTQRSLTVRTDANGIARAYVVRADELEEPLR